jgi:bifunctional non-homologous end joining protein LigD
VSLRDYRRKRDFEKSTEPLGRRFLKGQQHRFVVQKHAASRLHYDFRLEMGGTLKSWAVPKGIPFLKGEKRLAVEVEDHPVSYIDFEGTIPKGQYGGGTVMVWDRGTFAAHDKAPLTSLKAGKLHFTLAGKKLQGDWYLVRLRDERQWLLIKADRDMRPVSKKMDDTSARSGKSMKELGESRSVWNSKPTATEKRRVVASSLRKKVRANLTPKFIPPMLARPVSVVPHGEWMYELKFDGYRALLLKDGDEIQLVSRNEKDLSEKFPEVVEAALKAKANQAVIDGEVVAVDAEGRSSFQLLQAHALGEARPPILYFAFDLLQLNGEDWQDRPLTERKEELEKLIPKKTVLRFSPSLGSDGPALLDQIREHGLEGLIGKRADSLYESGRRTGAWVKIKVIQEQEVVIGGYTDPEGSRSHFGSLLIGVYDQKKLRFSGKVGTGFDGKLLRFLKNKLDALAQDDCPFVNLPEKRSGRYGQGVTSAEMKRCHWVAPRLVCQVKFHEWTRDGKLRQPVFLGLREDKAPKEVTREAT